MENVNIETLTKKLQNAPQNVLERVMVFVDALIESETNSKTYTLSEKQQGILDSQINSDKSTYIEAEKLYTDIKNKYEL